MGGARRLRLRLRRCTDPSIQLAPTIHAQTVFVVSSLHNTTHMRPAPHLEVVEGHAGGAEVLVDEGHAVVGGAGQSAVELCERGGRGGNERLVNNGQQRAQGWCGGAGQGAVELCKGGGRRAATNVWLRVVK